MERGGREAREGGTVPQRSRGPAASSPVARDGWGPRSALQRPRSLGGLRGGGGAGSRPPAAPLRGPGLRQAPPPLGGQPPLTCLLPPDGGRGSRGP